MAWYDCSTLGDVGQVTSASPWQLLAMRTDVRPAPGNFELDDGGTTTWTWLALAAEDVCKAQVAAFLAVRINIVAVGRAAFFDAEAQHRNERFIQLFELCLSKILYARLGVDFGAP